MVSILDLQARPDKADEPVVIRPKEEPSEDAASAFVESPSAAPNAEDFEFVVGRRQMAIQAIPVPSDARANHLIESECSSERRHIKVSACAHQHETRPFLAMLLDPTQRVGERSASEDCRDELGRPRLDLGARLTAESRPDEGRLDLSMVA